MKKLIKIILTVLLLASCHQPSKHRGADIITLTYWSANNQEEINLARKLVQEWNAAHPTIQVKHQPIPEGRSSEEVVLAAIVGKTTPDVFCSMWPGDVELYVRARSLVALDQFADFDSLAHDRFSEDKILEARSRDGHTYQILWKTNPIMMAYNKKMFAEAGFTDPPTTYEQYLQAAERITRDTNGDGYIDRWIGITQIMVTWWQRFFDYYPLYIAASGGKMLLDGDRVNFNNATSIEVFRFLQTLFQQGYFPKERMDARADVFIHGIVATRFTGPWAISQIEKFKGPDFEYDFAPIPRPSEDGPTYTYGDYKSIIIFKNSKYPEQAWQFVKHLVSRQADLDLLQIANQLPVRKNVLQDSLFQDYFKRNPMMAKFARQAEFVRGADSSPVLREIFDAISQEFEACVVYGKKSPEEAVASMAERAELIME